MNLFARLSRLVMPAILATTALMAGVLPAQAAQAAPAVHAAPAVQAAPNGLEGHFVFDKNPSNPADSKLTWVVNRTTAQGTHRVSSVSWRSGSGIGIKDPCATSRGWLPNGNYDVTLYEAYPGSDVRGVVFQLSNKKCSSSSTTVRTELFIHSEMTTSGGQDPGNEKFRWDGASDYLSNGCVKLTPNAIKSAAKRFKELYQPGHTYKNKLRVIS